MEGLNPSGSQPGRPKLHPGESYLCKWSDIKFLLSISDPQSSAWATLSDYFCYGILHVTTCRMIIQPHPRILDNSNTMDNNNQKNVNRKNKLLSIPLQWISKDKLKLRKPFFDSHHISGMILPHGILSNLILHPLNLNGAGDATNHGQRHAKSMNFRLELLNNISHSDGIHHLFQYFMSLLNDHQFIMTHFHVLKNALCSKLVHNHVHYAFVDPTNHQYLYLADQMSYPSYIDDDEEDDDDEQEVKGVYSSSSSSSSSSSRSSRSSSSSSSDDDERLDNNHKTDAGERETSNNNLNIQSIKL